MSAKDLYRIGAVLMVLIGAFGLLSSKKPWVRVLGLIALIVLFLDVEQFLGAFSASVNSVVAWIGSLTKGGAA